MNTIPWWYTEIGSAEKDTILDAFEKKCFSMGLFTAELEKQLASTLNVPYVVATNSGTSAITMALLAIGVRSNDEVIVPALTWVATAQAASVLGAKVVLADCLANVPVIDPEDVQKKITHKTKAIIPVHLNGRACNLEQLQTIAREADVYLIEDTCKGMFSNHLGKYLGTFGEMGCFSLGMISLLSIGYGGFVVTSDKDLDAKLRLIRDHGVVRAPEEYRLLGLNFKVSDLLAAIGVAQLKRLQYKLEHVRKIYECYAKSLDSLESIQILPIDLSSGKVPLYTEARTEYRDKLLAFLAQHNIETSKFHLPLQRANYLENQDEFPNASRFAEESFILPSGPSQPLQHVEHCIEIIYKWSNNL